VITVTYYVEIQNAFADAGLIAAAFSHLLASLAMFLMFVMEEKARTLAFQTYFPSKFSEMVLPRDDDDD
jgi:hypothetical protein